MVKLADANDMEKFRQVHDQFYKTEFDYPSWNDFIDVFIVDDVSIGGVRPILETIIVTDKNKPVQERRRALFQLLTAIGTSAKGKGYDQIHAFVQDNHWKAHLEKYDFRPTKGQALVLDI